MLRVEWTEEVRRAWRAQASRPCHSVRAALRLEMLRRVGEGATVDTVATHWGVSPKRVRRWIGRYHRAGWAGLTDRPRPGRPATLTPTHLAAVRTLLQTGDRTWSARQLAAWLAEPPSPHLPRPTGGALAGRWLFLPALCRCPQHPPGGRGRGRQHGRVGRPGKKGADGEGDVAYLDETGCALTLPTAQSWAVRGHHGGAPGPPGASNGGLHQSRPGRGP